MLHSMYLHAQGAEGEGEGDHDLRPAMCTMTAAAAMRLVQTSVLTSP